MVNNALDAFAKQDFVKALNCKPVGILTSEFLLHCLIYAQSAQMDGIGAYLNIFRNYLPGDAWETDSSFRYRLESYIFANTSGIDPYSYAVKWPTAGDHTKFPSVDITVKIGGGGFCVHEWTEYHGFNEIFTYCKKCDRKK